MARDLGDLMWGAVGERSQSLDGLTPEAGDLVRLHSRVRRGRAVRHVRDAAVAVPVVAAVVAGGWFGIDRMTQPAPVAPATQGPTDPAPDATDAPDGLEGLDLGDPVTEPGLPTYFVVPDGLIDRTEPGWVVTVHQPTRDNYDAPPEDEFETIDTALFLVAPDGTHFLVTKFGPQAQVYPVAWKAGTPRVDVFTNTLTADGVEGEPQEDLVRATFDLGSLELVAADGGGAGYGDTFPVPTSPSGRVVVGTGYGDTFALADGDDEGATLSYAVAGKDCGAVGWLDDTSFLALCVDDALVRDGGPEEGLLERDYTPALYEITLDGARVAGSRELQALAADDPLPELGAGVTVRDGAVAFPSVWGLGGCGTGVDLWIDGELRPVQRPVDQEDGFEVAAVDGDLFVAATQGCASEEGPSTLTSYDVAAETWQPLETAPADWSPNEAGRVSRGLRAWAVAD